MSLSECSKSLALRGMTVPRNHRFLSKEEEVEIDKSIQYFVAASADDASPSRALACVATAQLSNSRLDVRVPASDGIFS